MIGGRDASSSWCCLALFRRDKLTASAAAVKRDMSAAKAKLLDPNDLSNPTSTSAPPQQTIPDSAPQALVTTAGPYGAPPPDVTPAATSTAQPTRQSKRALRLESGFSWTEDLTWLRATAAGTSAHGPTAAQPGVNAIRAATLRQGT